ncbi:MAG: dipeptidase [Chitinophagaceae bacterium]|nr:dipeptidase [Chitinophagaceae bacterium]MBK7559125.1 dipeptidase [Chitinophagaceae bacterium]
MHKKTFICFFLIAHCLFAGAQSYKKLHFNAVVVDTHNDLLTTAIDKGLVIDQDLSGKTHSDLARLKKGGVDVQLFSVWCDGLKADPYAWANREMDTLDAVAKRNPDKIMKVGNTAELLQALKAKKIAAMFGVEGGHMIENSLDKLDHFYRRGARYMTLTWNNSTEWATSALDETTKADSLKHKGLTAFGKQVVQRMNELGMLVDLSHVGEQTFWDAINTSTKPVLVSHSCVYTLCPHRRNLKDDQIKAIAKNGGVIHLNFYSGFVDSSFERRSEIFNSNHKTERDSILKINPEPYFADVFLFEKYPAEVNALRPPLSMLLDHLDYIVKLAGVDHVGLGSDFDGINSAPLQLDDVTNMPLITKELLKRGYTKKDIRKILGENFLRLFEANGAK